MKIRVSSFLKEEMNRKVFQCQFSGNIFQGYRTLVKIEEVLSVKTAIIEEAVYNLYQDLYKLNLCSLTEILTKTKFHIHSKEVSASRIVYICECLQ